MRSGLTMKCSLGLAKIREFSRTFARVESGSVFLYNDLRVARPLPISSTVAFEDTQHAGVASQGPGCALLGLLATVTITFGSAEAQMSQAGTADGIKNVVLVHGGFVDGSGWEAVYRILKKDGFMVTIVQNPTISLANDVEATKRALATLDGPAILAGHSYGGVVITEAGNDSNVAGLVYIAAFAPDKGESVASLIKNPPPGAPVPPILPPQEGFLFLDKAKFHESFAADVDAHTAAFMADAQVPWGVEALSGAVTEPAWRSRPSWYLVATDDRMIPPDAQRAMAERTRSTMVEVKGSHAVYVSKPKEVAHLIEQAARSLAAVAVR
jgi:pimeloyl-ACP methyl ester carboxylesterase